METNDVRGVSFAAGEGTETLDVLGMRIVIKATGAETNGSLTLMEFTAPPGARGPAPHFHRRTEEVFYVLDGQMNFTLDGRAVEVRSGGCLLIPRGVPHHFVIPTSGPARFLVVLSPAGFDGFFRDLAAAMAGRDGRPDPAIIAALRAKYDEVPVATEHTDATRIPGP